MKEEWKEVKEFENYEVSNTGKIRNKGTKKELEPWIINSGYLTIAMSDGKKGHPRTVHRVVAKAFLDNSEEMEVVNHIDHNKLNNKASNLEWLSQKDNCKHSHEAGRSNSHTAREKLSKVSSKAVYQKDEEGNIIKLWESPTQAAKESNGYFRTNQIGLVANGERNHHRNYIWEFVDSESKRSRVMFTDMYSLDGELLHTRISVNKAMKLMNKNSHTTLKKVVEKSELEDRKIEYNGYLFLKHKE